METVCEHESPRPSALEEERLRMQMNLQQVASAGASAPATTAATATASGAAAPPPSSMRPSAPQMRGVRRYKSTTNSGSAGRGGGGLGVQRTTSMRGGGRPVAPTKSTDAAASLRGSAVARANSSRVLLRATSQNNGPRGLPSRTSSATGLQRPQFDRNQIVNTSIVRKNSNDSMSRGPGGTLQRHESDASLGDFSSADGSLFTMDSVALRKGQMIADPLEEGMYNEEDSFADHESFVTRDSDADFVRYAEANANRNARYNKNNHAAGATNHLAANTGSLQHQNPPVSLTFSDLEAVRMTQRLKISTSSDDRSVESFGTLASCLTTDFTEEQDDSEYACDETEYAE